MKKLAGLFIISVFTVLTGFSQNNTDYIQPPSLGIHFFYNDFESAANVRATSLSSALSNNQFGKIGKMKGGVMLNYIQGIKSKLDFSSSLAMSSLEYPLRKHDAVGEEKILLEADASIRAKMLSSQYIVNPFVQAGVGAFQWNGYYGAYIPAGVGLQFNIGQTNSILINAQYKIPITEQANYAFFYSLGFVGKIGERKK
jgi:OmpA-OmpF porin, OOP family